MYVFRESFLWTNYLASGAFLYGWPLAVVFANIQVSKQVDIGGISTALGNVMFAPTYLATDILNEKYGDRSSKNAVKIAAAALIAYIIFAMFTHFLFLTDMIR